MGPPAGNAYIHLSSPAQVIPLQRGAAYTSGCRGRCREIMESVPFFIKPPDTVTDFFFLSTQASPPLRFLPLVTRVSSFSAFYLFTLILAFFFHSKCSSRVLLHPPLSFTLPYTLTGPSPLPHFSMTGKWGLSGEKWHLFPCWWWLAFFPPFRRSPMQSASQL